MKRRFRLTKSKDFQQVQRYGKSYAHPLLVLKTSPNQQTISRIGVIAGRSVGKAVQRNRAKRLLRAAVMSFMDSITPGWDIILIARNATTKSNLKDIQAALESLLERALLLQN